MSIKPGQIIWTENGYPFEVLELRLAKDFPGDPSAYDAVIVKMHKDHPGYKNLKNWQKPFTAMWRLDSIITEGQQATFNL